MLTGEEITTWMLYNIHTDTTSNNPYAFVYSTCETYVIALCYNKELPCSHLGMCVRVKLQIRGLVNLKSVVSKVFLRI